MPVVSLRAHFDGQSIQLDEPFQLPPNAKLLVTVLAPSLQTEEADWLDLARHSLSAGYGPDEPEYGDADLRP